MHANKVYTFRVRAQAPLLARALAAACALVLVFGGLAQFL